MAAMAKKNIGVRPLTFYILIFFLRTTEHNLTKLGMNDP